MYLSGPKVQPLPVKMYQAKEGTDWPVVTQPEQGGAGWGPGSPLQPTSLLLQFVGLGTHSQGLCPLASGSRVGLSFSRSPDCGQFAGGGPTRASLSLHTTLGLLVLAFSGLSLDLKHLRDPGNMGADTETERGTGEERQRWPCHKRNFQRGSGQKN